MDCMTCGNEISQIKNKKGRPREYCSDDCASLSKFFNATSRLALTVNFSTEKKKLFVGGLFRLANQIHANHK